MEYTRENFVIDKDEGDSAIVNNDKDNVLLRTNTLELWLLAMGCTKEYRMGETCGLKLVFDTTQVMDSCKLCKDMEKKQRRYSKLHNDIIRWQREGNRNATIEKAQRDMEEIEDAIRRMSSQHETRMYSTS
ncbi:hypothetical protein DL768_007672 [Monosporascus sp. mg162]|nr:hypothetical protein DL768_007672 [Monosporascus sp. mg162]